MSHFFRNGNQFRIADDRSLDLYKHLPAGNYIVKQDMFKNFYLEQVDSFEHKGKIYGDTLKTADRILNTFFNRTSGTGVMLNGEKGSGKTLLAKILSSKGAERDVPTLLLNQPWCGDDFNKLIQDIDQPCILLFDEFEKVYDHDQQESILTLLDGVFPSQKLFVITCNDKWRVDQHMRNRPGRIYYMLDFKGLDVDFIREYCEDNLKTKKHIDTICKISSLFSEFNFDMLKALVEEMNRYGETPQEALKMLNAKPEFGNEVVYEVQAIVANRPVEEENLSPTRWKGNPLNRGFEIEWYDGSREEDDNDGSWRTIEFSQNDLASVNSQDGKFVFTNQKGTVILTRQRTNKSVDYYAAF